MTIEEQFDQAVTVIDKRVYEISCERENLANTMYSEYIAEDEVKSFHDRLAQLSEERNHISFESIILKKYYRIFFKEEMAGSDEAVKDKFARVIRMLVKSRAEVEARALEAYEQAESVFWSEERECYLAIGEITVNFISTTNRLAEELGILYKYYFKFFNVLYEEPANLEGE